MSEPNLPNILSSSNFPVEFSTSMDNCLLFDVIMSFNFEKTVSCKDVQRIITFVHANICIVTWCLVTNVIEAQVPRGFSMLQSNEISRVDELSFIFRFRNLSVINYLKLWETLWSADMSSFVNFVRILSSWRTQWSVNWIRINAFLLHFWMVALDICISIVFLVVKQNMIIIDNLLTI